MHFEWDEKKNSTNKKKHGIDFKHAQYTFADPKRVIALDSTHSSSREERYFCYGRIEKFIVTVRFTYRNNKIRIFGAGYWREGKKVYEKANKI